MLNFLRGIINTRLSSGVIFLTENCYASIQGSFNVLDVIPSQLYKFYSERPKPFS